MSQSRRPKCLVSKTTSHLGAGHFETCPVINNWKKIQRGRFISHSRPWICSIQLFPPIVFLEGRVRFRMGSPWRFRRSELRAAHRDVAALQVQQSAKGLSTFHALLKDVARVAANQSPQRGSGRRGTRVCSCVKRRASTPYKGKPPIRAHLIRASSHLPTLAKPGTLTFGFHFEGSPKTIEPKQSSPAVFEWNVGMKHPHTS